MRKKVWAKQNTEGDGREGDKWDTEGKADSDGRSMETEGEGKKGSD